MNSNLFILKIGGRVMDNPDQLDHIIEEFAKLSGPRILVHGGGSQASELSKKLGLAPKMVNGRRITDESTLQVVTMVYAGLVNKNLVAKMQARNINAIGLSGADGNIIPAKKRPVKEIDFGFAGDLKDSATASESLEILLNHGFVPVCCPLTHDGQGQLLNTNADTIASHLAITFGRKYQVTLAYCMDKPGVMLDPNDRNSVINQLDPGLYEELVSNGTIAEGMIPKLDNAFSGLRLGVKNIYLCDWQDIKGTSGTRISLS